MAGSNNNQLLSRDTSRSHLINIAKDTFVSLRSSMTGRGQIYISYYKSPYHRGLAPAPPSLIQSHGLCLLGPKTTDSTFAEYNFEALASWGGFLKWGPGTVHTQSLEMLGLKKKKKRQNPDLDSQTSPGAVELDPQWGWGQEPGILHSPPRHPKAHSVSLTLGRGGGGLPLLAPLPC